jgi:RNA polymerase sigma-70 factor (ECF subfamily)
LSILGNQRRIEPSGGVWHKQEMDEASIIAGLRAGDAAATATLLDVHGDRLLRSAFVLCGNATEAQDLAQETLLQAIKSVQRFRGASALYTWLHGILLNLARHHARKNARLTITDAVPETAAESAPPGLALDQASDADALWNALGRLTPAHHEVLVLRFYEELRLDEIAARLELSTGTVKSRLHYALRELRKKLPQR